MSKDVIIRIVVEAVSRRKEDRADPAYWDNVHDWALLHMVHLDCAAKLSNSDESFEYEQELNELPLDEMAEELVKKEKKVPLLKIVRNG